MTAADGATVPAPRARRGRAPWVDLARIEARRYLGRPAFLLGAALTGAALLPYLDGDEPTDELSMIAPAALIGLVGIAISAQRVRASDRCADAAGPTPVRPAARTVAHLVTAGVPFFAGLGFVAVTVLRWRSVPTPPSGYAAMMPDRWVVAVWVALGAVSCLGGPILGVVVARRTRWAPAPIVASVGLVLVVIVFQGLFAPLRRVRVVLPWTYWGGPFGVDGDPQRSIVMTGSPEWWLVYLLALCTVGALVAVRHDPDARTARSRIALAVAVGIALVALVLAMGTGTPSTRVSPVPGATGGG